MNRLRSLFGAARTQQEIDAERAQSISSIPDPTEHSALGEGDAMKGTHVVHPSQAHHVHHPSEIVPQADKLATFRRLTGIDTSHTLSKVRLLHRPAINLGIYARVVRAQWRYRRSYKTFSILINACLGLQIIIAAALTALGASDGSRGAVTVFGAANTVIAGFLTYLKGSGLPNRLRYYDSEWRRVREYIEQRERDFLRENCSLDPVEEAMIVERMYEIVRADVEANVPDTYVSVTAPPKVGASVPRLLNESPPGAVDATEKAAVEALQNATTTKEPEKIGETEEIVRDTQREKAY